MSYRNYQNVDDLEGNKLNIWILRQKYENEDKCKAPRRKERQMHVLLPVIHPILFAQPAKHMLQVIFLLCEPRERCVFELVFVGIQKHTIREGEYY